MKSAVDIGASAAKKVGELVSAHLIPKPYGDMGKISSLLNREGG